MAPGLGTVFGQNYRGGEWPEQLHPLDIACLLKSANNAVEQSDLLSGWLGASPIPGHRFNLGGAQAEGAWATLFKAQSIPFASQPSLDQRSCGPLAWFGCGSGGRQQS